MDDAIPYDECETVPADQAPICDVCGGRILGVTLDCGGATRHWFCEKHASEEHDCREAH